MRARLLGDLEVSDGRGQWQVVGSRSQRVVLAALLAHLGDVVPADTLVDALWGDEPPASAVPTLRTYVSRLRTLLGVSLVTRGSGFALELSPLDVDAGRFEDLVEQAKGAEPNAALALFDQAMTLWRGPAFADQADVSCVRAEARRLEERYGAAVEGRAAALLRAGRCDEAVAAAEALVTSEPLREAGWAVLMEALAAADRSAEALRAYQRASQVLAESGLEPSARLRAAERAVLEGAPPVATPPPAHAATAPPPPAGGGAAPAIPASTFIGRDHDREHVDELVARARLVTLVGPGGVGKTRLALEAARLAATRFTQGARVVELASVDDAAAVADLVVTSLGLATDGGPATDALDRAGHLDVLVVLDNAEHIIDAVAATVERLLGRGDALHVLVTSRERVGVDGEHVWTVAPLPTAGTDAPARRLFVERARAVLPELDVTTDDDIVGRVVDRLDGLPLAIEMAAAHLTATSLPELLSDLERHHDTLRSPRRNVEERHRSLASVLAWSETRLARDEATTLAELSVFSGPFEPLDVEGVLGDRAAVDRTRSLAARSLVTIDRRASTSRFSLLQTVRSFAARRLEEVGRFDALAEQHARWFSTVAAIADRQLRTVEEGEGCDRLDGCFGELRAAHQWAQQHDHELDGTLISHLYIYGYSRLVDEPLRWAEEQLTELPDDHPQLPSVLAAAATRASQRGDLATARQLATRALELVKAGRTGLAAYEALGDVDLFEGRLDDCMRCYTTLAERAREAGDLYYLAVAHTSALMARCYAGEQVDGRELDFLEALPLGPSQRGWVAYTRGELLLDRDPGAAFAYFDQTLALARPVRHRFLEGVALVSSCSLRARAGDVTDALQSFSHAIGHWHRSAATTLLLTTLRNLAVLFQRIDQPALAAELLGSVERDDVPTFGEEAERLTAVQAWAHERLGAEGFGEWFAVGAARDDMAAAEWAMARLADLLR